MSAPKVDADTLAALEFEPTEQCERTLIWRDTTEVPGSRCTAPATHIRVARCEECGVRCRPFRCLAHAVLPRTWCWCCGAPDAMVLVAVEPLR